MIRFDELYRQLLCALLLFVLMAMLPLFVTNAIFLAKSSRSCCGFRSRCSGTC